MEEIDDPGLDAMLLAAERLATQMQNWSQSETSTQVSESGLHDESCGGSYCGSSESYDAEALSEANESLCVPSLNPTTMGVDDMLRKAEVLMTEMRRSSSAGDAREESDDSVEQKAPATANFTGDVDAILERAELLVARMHSASQTSFDEDDEEDGVVEPQNLDLLMLQAGSGLSSGGYSSAANTDAETPDVLEQAEEILKRIDAASIDETTFSNDGTATITSLGSDMAVASRMGIRFNDRAGIDHARSIDHDQLVKKAEEMARLMQEAVSSHMPLDEANDLLNVKSGNEDVIERVVTALRKTASEEQETAAASQNSNSAPKPRDESSSSFASNSQRSESLRSESIRSGSMRSGASRQLHGSVIPPPPPFPKSIPDVPPPPVAPPVEKVSKEQLPSEKDSDFVPVADYRSNKNVNRKPPAVPSISVPKVMVPPPPRRVIPAVVSVDDEDFVPVADFSSISSGSATREKPKEWLSPSPRSVSWERVERAFHEDDDFVPVMDFRNATPKEQGTNKGVVSTSKHGRKAGVRRLILGTVAALALGCIVWYWLNSQKSTKPRPTYQDNGEGELSSFTLTNESDQFRDPDQDAKELDEISNGDLVRQVRIIWNYAENICHIEDEDLAFYQDAHGECEIIDLARRDDENETPRKQKKGGFKLPPFVCKIPHLSNLLARHCRHLSE